MWGANDPSLSIAAEPFDSADARQLVAALDATLAALYPPEQRFGPNLKPEHLEGGRGTFLVARDRTRAVGCGALRLLDPSTAEVKRMYVEPDQRGKGIGRAMLANLEAAALEMGVARLVLETGVHQEAAISLYRQAGFAPVGCWASTRRRRRAFASKSTSADGLSAGRDDGGGSIWPESGLRIT